MSQLVFTSGKPTHNWESVLQDILENGSFTLLGASTVALSMDYNGMHLLLSGSNLEASALRTITSGTITGFSISVGNQNILTMTGLTLLGSDELQVAIDGAGGLAPGGTALRSLIAPLFNREAVVATGSSGGDSILGSSLVDHLSGAAGDDVILGGDGLDRLAGGSGVDMLDYRFDARSVGIKVDLGANSVVENNSGATRIDYITGFENLAGSVLDDNIRGTNGNNKLLGDAGNDMIFGLAGNDGLFGGSGDDLLSGGSGNNYFNGGAGADRFFGGVAIGFGMWDKVSYEFETGSHGIVANFTGGGVFSVTDTYGFVDIGTSIEEIKGSSLADKINGSAGSETAEGMAGGDTFTMAGGVDTIVYQHEYDAGSRKGVIVNLSNANISANTGSGQVTLLKGTAIDSFGSTDTLVAVENIVGTRYADHIVGSGLANQLIGGAGTDILSGLDGKDTLIGGLGRDKMTGGSGFDLFRFVTAGDTGATAISRDVITDFRHLVDEIDLNAIDASTKVAGNNAFKWIGTSGFHGVAGELHFRFVGANTTLIEGDRNGDSKADFAIELSNHVVISLADVIL
jgi:serralysin